MTEPDPEIQAEPVPEVAPVLVPHLDDEAMHALAERQLTLAKPPGSLGQLEVLAGWVAAVQGAAAPRPFERVRVVLFAGDHGVAAGGVSAHPPGLTRALVAAIGSGGTAVDVLARQVGATVRVVDVSVDGDTPEAAGDRKIRSGTGDIRVEDAMTSEQTEAAIALGRAIADEEVDSGADLLIAGDLGVGNTTVGATLAASYLQEEPVAVVGRDATLDDAAWCRKVAAIRDALRRVRQAYVGHDPTGLLTVAGGPDVAALAGFLLQAAVRRTPVVLDGLVSCVAALLANDIEPGTGAWQIAGHRSAEPAQAKVLAGLGKVPLLDLSMRLGEGTGALLAVPVLRAAIATATEVGTLAEVTGASASGD